jgi:hypothetical protein
MTVMVYAAPYVPPAPPRNPWTGVKMTWRGWDGTAWPLTHQSSGVILGPGVRGLTEPQFAQYTSDAPGVHGQRFRGYRTEAREVFWPITVWEDSDDIGWLEYDSAFWNTMRVDKEGTWEVIHPLGTKRSLKLRFVDDGDVAWDQPPGFRRWAKYGVTFVADDPFWSGDQVSSPVWGQAESPIPFTGEDDSAPEFYIGPASTINTASLNNTGDVAAWPVWEITGPITSASITLDGGTIGIPFPLQTGEKLVIDTGVPRAVSGGEDVTGMLNPFEFTPIPAQSEVPVSISMVGSGTVQAKFTPRYFRAW